MNLGGFDWTNRRRWIWRVTAFCMVVVAFCLWRGDDSRLYETAITWAFGLLGTLGGAYVFGAAWEHRSLVKGITESRKAEGQ
jgi:hypothetical protein